MLKILLCEDDPHQRAVFKKMIEEYITQKGLDMILALAVNNPEEALEFTENGLNEGSLYFLDVNLNHKINGIDLGAAIRNRDVKAKIVFVTSHGEMAHLAFKHKLEAMDYIVKNSDNVELRLKECLDTAYERYIQRLGPPEEYYTITTGKQISNIPISEILFFETDLSAPNRLILHTINSHITFRGTTIKDIASAHPHFFRCHQSIVVNVKNIKHINKATRTLEMSNGEIAPVGTKKIGALSKLISAFAEHPLNTIP